MLSINTNLSSLIAQSSLQSSTAKLNQAIERMSTGFKINHAKDNAANYSISQNMQIQISSYDVAADNVAMGMDLVTTASDIISTMQDHASRLQALSTQARNGTYGAQSMAAINSEAAAIMAEINRLYSTAEYNNVSLFNRKAYELTPEHQTLTETLNSEVKAKAEYNGFIEDPKTYTDEEVAAMTRVKDVSTFSSGQKYAIYTVEELQKLADYVNSGKSTAGFEFVLGADIDLSAISNWTPIGYYNSDANRSGFMGTFDGNGHTIKNLTINNPIKNSQALFGCIQGASEIKNIGVECNITGNQYVGGLIGVSFSCTVNNSYSTGTINGIDSVGGLIGFTWHSDEINSSYSNCTVSGMNSVGGLVGINNATPINNSYTTSVVSGVSFVGGLVGESTRYSCAVNNSYSTGTIEGVLSVGGLVGSGIVNINNCYANGNVIADSQAGGLVGEVVTTGYISNSYSTSNVSADEYSGGLVGILDSSVKSGTAYLDISDSAQYGTISSYSESSGNFVGGYIGYDDWNNRSGDVSIVNCQSVYSLENNIGVKFDKEYVTNSNFDPDTSSHTEAEFDISYIIDEVGITDYDDEIVAIALKNIMTTLQVGINSDSSNQISFDTNFEFNLGAPNGDIASDNALAAIMEFQKLLSEKSTALGSVENRLQSAVESIEVNIENLTSSLSTIRDADIAEVSSEYIRQQILQQASATLMATANQSPSIALQLI